MAIIGAGPIGLEAAAGAVRRGFRVTVLERGSGAAANVRSWGHVSLFSNNSLNLGAEGLAFLEHHKKGDSDDLAKAEGNLKEVAAAFVEPDKASFPTGAELVGAYLEPLAAALAAHDLVDLRYHSEVISVGRGGLSKGQAIGPCEERRRTKFEVLVVVQSRQEELLGRGQQETLVSDIDVVIDASGTYGNPNWLGKGGRPALGERALRGDGAITYTLPTISTIDAALAGGGDIAVIGSGASAITTLALLKRQYTTGAQKSSPSPSRVFWITRRAGAPYTLIPNDPLPQRAALQQLGNSLAAASNNANATDSSDIGPGAPAGEQPQAKHARSGELGVTHRGGFQVTALARRADGDFELQLQRAGSQSTDSVVVRHVFAHVGYRPDTKITAELQVHYCYASEGPMKLAAAMIAASGGSGGGGDCLAQVLPGPGTLLNPEPDFFIIGMKSYGRGSAFLLRLGFEQVQHVLTLLGSAASKGQ